MEQTVLLVEAGDYTQDLIQFIFRSLDDADVDSVHLEKRIEPRDLAFEPVIIGASLTLATTVAVLVCRIIEKWIEQRGQERKMLIIRSSAADGNGPDVVQALKEIATKYADVSIATGVASLPSAEKGSA